MKTAPEPLGSGAVLQASRREAEPRRQLLRRHTQEQQSARGGQKGQGGGAGREGEHQLLLLHHRPAQGDQLPLAWRALRARASGPAVPGSSTVPQGTAPAPAQPRAAGDAVSSSSRAPASSAGCRPARTSAASSPNPASTAVRIPSSRSQIPTRKLRHLPLCCSVRKIWDFMRHLSRNAARALTFAA